MCAYLTRHSDICVPRVIDNVSLISTLIYQKGIQICMYVCHSLFCMQRKVSKVYCGQSNNKIPVSENIYDTVSISDNVLVIQNDRA